MELHEIIEKAAGEIQRSFGVSEGQFKTREEFIEFVCHCAIGAVVAAEGCTIEEACERLRSR
jgi:hypothetical protein